MDLRKQTQVAFLLLWVVALASCGLPDPFPYQAHSFNDLDVTLHLLQRGVKYFKFDASLANRESCHGQSTWDHSPCITLPEYAQEMCCIAMRGDASSEPNFNYPFNTSFQFVAFLDSFLSSHADTSNILLVAIDFQFSFTFENTLAERFMYDLATLMNDYPRLQVTTKGEYLLQFDRVCRFGQSGPSQQKGRLADISCTQSRKHISDSRFFLQSGSTTYPSDPRDYKKRYRNFNTIFREIDNLCQHGFPTWPNAHPEFPLIFWEPSNELQIQESLSKLMSPACQKKHNRSLEGIAFASNIDPEMFDLGMRPTQQQQTLQSWYPLKTKAFVPNAKKIKLAALQANPQEEFLVMYRMSQESGQVKNTLSVHQINFRTSEVTLIRSIDLEEEVEELRTVGERIIIVNRRSITPGNRHFNATLVSYDLGLLPVASVEVTDFITSSSLENQFYYMTLSSNPQVFLTYSCSGDLDNKSQYKLPVLMPASQIQSISSMHFHKSQSDIVQLITGNDNKKTWIAQIKESQVHSETTLTFGVNSRIVANRQRVIIFLEDSYTHGGLLMNNNGQNSCLYHKSPKLEPLAHLPGLITGIETSLPDLLSFIEQNPSDNIVTACHPKMIFAKYMNGHRLQVAAIWDRVLLSAQYLPISKQDFVTAVFSGGTNFDRRLRDKEGFLLASTRPIWSNQASRSSDVRTE